MGAPRADNDAPHVAPPPGAERRRAPRTSVAIPVELTSSLRFPRGDRGHGTIDEVGPGGARLLTAIRLDAGEWIRVAWTPSLRDINAMPADLRRAKEFRARVVRPLEGGYAVELPQTRKTRTIALFDVVLPWIGIALILGAGAHVVWLRGNNLYYFWYHPIVNLYGILISSYILSRIVLACFYRPPKDVGFLPPITVALSCKNEEGSIGRTIDCIFASNYPREKLQVIAVDDGSTDGTWEEMNRAKERHPSLELIRFEQNRGKRHGMGAAARKATGDVVVYVDSDSFVRPDALRQIVQGFVDHEVGAVCGHARVENAGENFLTKMQEVRYYVAFRIVKAAESLFSTVTCCSGCLAAYRRQPLMNVLDVWLAQSFLGRSATFGDDRSLTNFMLRRWRVIYDSRAVCSTIVPATLSVFFRQQLRWKKSWIRESLLASLFMWKRHPLAAFYFYLGVVFPLVSPAVVFMALVLPLCGLGEFSYMYIYGTTLMALLYGLVYLVRHKTGLWFYGLAFSIFYMLVLVWQTYYALATVRRNHWGTR
ncbi:MAG TPA: glycosyltransferase [Candidatus Polarisedimenticolaceae bacterium]|nr:glycosyltransferase [Candidatus Polarisedimenticolaceae bacterium]